MRAAWVIFAREKEKRERERERERESLICCAAHDSLYNFIIFIQIPIAACANVLACRSRRVDAEKVSSHASHSSNLAKREMEREREGWSRI
jgi:hypothetical protein